MQEPEFDLGFELLKYSLVLVTIPFWVPFAKALWEEFVRAMRPDGGLTGRVLSGRERREIEEHIAATEESSQVHEPIAHLRTQATGTSAAGRAQAPPRPGRPLPKGGPQLGSQRRAFTPGPAPGKPAAGRSRPRFR